MRRRAAAAFVLVLGLLASGGGAARATPGHPADLDPAVAAAADAAPAGAQIPVIVYGRSLGAADRELTLTASLSGEEAAGTVAAGDVDRLASEPNVAYVAPDVPVATQGAATDGPAFGSLAALFPYVDGAPQAWAQGLTGAGVGIAVVDSGLDVHAAFGVAGAARVDTTAGAYGGNDRIGHGSLVASIAAGQSDDGRFAGVAPGADVVAYNVADGDTIYTSDVLRGLAWVLANQQRYGIRVVNLSLAETQPSSYLTSPLDAAVELLWRDAHIVVVAAGGNLGPGQVDYAPANDPFVLSVGATDPNGTVSPADDALTPWSAYGTTVDGVAKPELVAPGRRVVGALAPGSELAQEAPAWAWVAPPTYVAISGTSFAAPQVAGAAAVLLQEHPDWTPDEVKWVLETTARPVAGSDAGALDLAAAVAYSGDPESANGGVQPSAFSQPGWVDAALQPAAHGQASWTRGQASWTRGQASWTRGQASWTHSQASWTRGQASWTGIGGS